MTASNPPLPSRGTIRSNARALEWWQRYCHPVEGDSATRARLRRCRSATDAVSVPAAVHLARMIGGLSQTQADDDHRVIAALDLSRVLAHVTQHVETQRPMQTAGWKSFPGERRESDAGEDRPILSEVRFRRLLASARGEAQVSAFIRLIALLGGAVNVTALADDFIFWNDRTKRRWAFDYYAAGVAAPADSDTLSEDTDA